MKKVTALIVMMLFVLACSTAFAGKAGSSSSYAPPRGNSRAGSSSSYAYKTVSVQMKVSSFELKEKPWNSSRTIYTNTKDYELVAYAKYHDRGNDIFWIKIECPPNSGTFGWAGAWRFDILPSELEYLPYEYFDY
ncbi:MAG: hypothetical protein IJ719_22075 [Clostridia bacterium]|nr:hypothetical protein [Clostridia bacterium]